MTTMIDNASQAFIILIVFISIPIVSTVGSSSIDWCEYWAKVGRKTDRPECVGYEQQSGFKRTETFPCSKTEIYSCLDCEPTCHNLAPKCRKEQCNKGCVCKNGLARNSEGKCVALRDCSSQFPPKNDSVKGDEEDGTVMKTVRKMVPVIVNDVWKALFNSISTPDSIASDGQTKKIGVISPVLTPVETESNKTKTLNVNFMHTSEVKEEKQTPKGFYIDYP